MQVYLDESGDSGIKRDSSEHFIVTLILIEDDFVEALEASIRQLRQELHRPEGFEFHFRDCSDRVRKAFLEAVVRHKFLYFTCVVNKSGYYAEGLPGGREFYRWVCGEVFEQAKPYLLEARITLDEHSERQFVQEMRNHLRWLISKEEAEVAAMRSVRSASSRASDLLQLADMVCGAVARSFRADRDEPDKYRKIIKHRGFSVLTLPE